jgi:hypothetical protein
MRPLNAVIAIASLALAAGAAGAADTPPGPPPQERWNALDTDGDGSLDRAEAEAGAPGLARNFDRFDTDADGRLTREEIRAQRARMHEQARARAEERWAAADANGDGAIDLAEAQTGMPRAAQEFGRLDADGNGLLSRDEMRAALRQRHAERTQLGNPGAGPRKQGAGKPAGGG